MFQRAKLFVRNHWKKVVIGGIAVQVATYGLRYATQRLLMYQDDQAQLYWKKVKKQQHFESLEENCITTFRQLFQFMKLTVGQTLNAELIQERLKLNQVESKLKAWEELKMIAFTRVLVTIYGSSVLYVLLRIQLSVVGGYLIKESVSNHSNSVNDRGNSTTKSIDQDTQTRYLELSHQFATVGIIKVCNYFKEKVKSIVSQMPLKQTLSASDVEQTLWAIIRKDISLEEVQDNPCKYSWKYIFPDELLQNYEFFRESDVELVGDPDVYKKLICETYDLLESDDAKDILRSFESHGVSHFVDRISDSITDASTEMTFEDQEGFAEPRVALAKLIPTITSLHLVDVLDDPWIHLLTNSDSVRVLSANIYEAFSSE